MFFQEFQNIFKDRNLPFNANLQHPLQFDPNHPAHPDHPENPANSAANSVANSASNSPKSSMTIAKDPSLDLRTSAGIRASVGIPMTIIVHDPPTGMDSSTHIIDPIDISGASMNSMSSMSSMGTESTDTTNNSTSSSGISTATIDTNSTAMSPLSLSPSSGEVATMGVLVHNKDRRTSTTSMDHDHDHDHDMDHHHAVSLITSTGSDDPSSKRKRKKRVHKTVTEYVTKKIAKLRSRLHSNIPKVRAKLDKITVDGIFSQTVVIPFLLELGRALHLCGVPAHRLEYELTLVASSFGIDGNYFYTPTGIFCSFGDPNTVLSPYTHLIRVGGADFDLEKLCLLEELALDISKKRLHCAEGINAIHTIMTLPPRYPRALVIMSIIMCSFAIGIMFGLGWIEVGVTSLAAMYVAVVLYAAERIPAVGRIIEAISGFGCGIIASIFSSYVIHINMFIVALGGVIWFVPGLSITLAVAELSTRNLISGTTRLMSAFSCILQLTFGIEAGIKLGEVFMHPKVGAPTSPLANYWNYIATVICALSFSILLRVPPKQVWAVFIASFLGTIGGQYGTQWMGNSIGAFFGALLICVFGNLYARIVQKSVSSVPIIAGILLLVPGSLGVKAFTAIGDNDVEGGLGNIGTMFQTAMSLTMGLLTANLLVRPYKAL